MLRWKKVFMLLGVVGLAATAVAAQGHLTDPYEILKRNFEANGGLERLKAEVTQYVEGNLAVSGLKGTIKAWTAKPDKSRVDVDLGILKISQGDNGEYQWVLDSNGKLQKITNPDQATIDRKKVKRLMDDFEYADRNSKVFTVTLDGVQKVDDIDCYVLTFKNSINRDVYSSYINIKSFMLEKATAIEGEDDSETRYGDYREIDGIKVAFYSKKIDHTTGQVEEMTIAQYVSNPDIDPSQFEPSGESKKDYRFVSGNSSENIPFRLIGNHIFVPVVVNCKERLWVLDTGASMSVLDQRFADSLGLESKGEIKGKGAGGSLDVSLRTMPPFTIQGIEFDEQATAVIDMSELIRLVGVDIVGILGFDFLSRFVTKVDYAKERLSFYDPETFEYKGDGRELGIHLKESVFYVEATLDGQYSGTWIFDLGAGSTSLEGPYAVLHGFAKKRGVESIGHGAFNAYPNKAIKGTTFELAGFKVDEPPISFSYGGTDTLSQSDNIGGLGNTLFRNFVLYCDYANEKVILEKGADFNKSFPEDNSGLKLTRTESDEISVFFVSPDTPAANAGFMTGDIVRSINGIDIGCFRDINAVRDMLMEEPGTQYTFVVDRGGQTKDMKLKLAYLY